MFGSPAEIVEQLGAYRAAGVDELLLNVGGVYNTEVPVAALRDLDDITSVLDAA